MARLDRLADGQGWRSSEQCWGGTFSYELLQAIRRWTRQSLQAGLAQLVHAEYSTNGVTAAGRVSVQACLDPGRGLSVVAQEHPAAASPADCPGHGSAVSRGSWRRSPSSRPALHAAGYRAGDALLAAGRPTASDRSAYLEAISHLTTGSRCSGPSQRRRSIRSILLTLTSPSARPCRWGRGRQRPKRSTSTPRRARCLSRSARRDGLSRCCLGCYVLCDTGAHSTRRANSGKHSCV